MRENIKTDNKKIIKAASIILVVLVLTLFFAEKKTFALVMEKYLKTC